jgi:hypothetical protein
LRTKAGHGGEIGEANVTIGLWWMGYMRVLERMRVNMNVGMGMEMEMGMRVGVRVRVRVPTWVSLAV